MNNDSMEQAIQYVASNLSAAQRREAREYIDQLLAGATTDEELHRIWRRSPSDWGIERGIRHWFAGLRDAMKREEESR